MEVYAQYELPEGIAFSITRVDGLVLPAEGTTLHISFLGDTYEGTVLRVSLPSPYRAEVVIERSTQMERVG